MASITKRDLWNSVQQGIGKHGDDILLGPDTAILLIKTRASEKRELNDLNELLDAFIRKVGTIHAGNQQIGGIIGIMEQDVIQLKQKYEPEIAAIQNNLNQSIASKANLETRIARLTHDIEFYRKEFELSVYAGRNVDELERKIRDTNVLLEEARRKAEALVNAIKKLIEENNDLEARLETARSDLDRERQKKLEFYNQANVLQKKNQFLNDEFHFKIADRLDNIVVRPGRKWVDCHEVALAIRGIQGDFAQWSSQNKLDFERLRKTKLSEFYAVERLVFDERRKRTEEEIKEYEAILRKGELKNEKLIQEFKDLERKLALEKEKHMSVVRDLNDRIRILLAENVSLQKELKVLITSNHTLRAEIEIYRKMIGGRNVFVEVIPDTVHTDSEEFLTRIVATRWDKNSRVRFGSVPLDGEYLEIVNFSDEVEDLSDWRLAQYVDDVDKQPSESPLPRVKLEAGKSIKIWNKGRHANEANVFEGVSWTGKTTLKCSLLDQRGEVKATYERRRTDSRRVSGES